MSGLLDKLHKIHARHASNSELTRFHTPSYVDKIKRLSDDEGGNAGEQARFGHGGFEIATLAAGGV